MPGRNRVTNNYLIIYRETFRNKTLFFFPRINISVTKDVLPFGKKTTNETLLYYPYVQNSTHSSEVRRVSELSNKHPARVTHENWLTFAKSHSCAIFSLSNDRVPTSDSNQIPRRVAHSNVKLLALSELRSIEPLEADSYRFAYTSNSIHQCDNQFVSTNAEVNRWSRGAVSG